MLIENISSIDGQVLNWPEEGEPKWYKEMKSKFQDGERAANAIGFRSRGLK
jgi:hypothetical protein